MNNLRFSHSARHGHVPLCNANELFEQQATLGQHAANRVASIVDSWPFLIIQSILLVLWMVPSAMALLRKL